MAGKFFDDRLRQPAALRREHDEVAGIGILRPHGFDTFDHRLDLEDHAGAAAERPIVDRAMLVFGPIADVVQPNVDQAAFDRQLQQALTQIAGKNFREQA